MSSDTTRSSPLRRLGRSTPAFSLIVVVAIGVYGLIRYDLIVAAEYRVARVIAVQQVAGYDASERQVVVDLGTYQRALRTSDWLLRTDLGRPVCVKRSTLLLRRWVRHRLVLPGYCKLLRAPPKFDPLAAGPLED